MGTATVIAEQIGHLTHRNISYPYGDSNFLVLSCVLTHAAKHFVPLWGQQRHHADVVHLRSEETFHTPMGTATESVSNAL